MARRWGGRRMWERQEDAELRRLYPHRPTAAIARQMRRSLSSVYQRARILRLYKSAAYMASPEAYRFRRGQGRGEAFRFPKGHVPANKGIRRPGWGPGRMKQTQFKQGAMPQTWVPVGTAVRVPDGYVKRKMADDRTRPSRFNWKFVHVLVWETAHGPVPRGHAIVFRNGDKSDTSLRNLECLTRRALMLRNSVHNLPEPLAKTVQLLGALNRQIRRRTREADQQHG